MLVDTIQDVQLVTVQSDDDNDIQSELIGNHYATIFAKNDCRIEYRKRRKNASMITELHPVIIHWFERELFNPVSSLYGKSVIRIYCEYKRDKINFRAHPNFRQSGAWHDWVMVAYETEFDPEDDPDLVKLTFPFHCGDNPSKIMCFFWWMTRQRHEPWFSHVVIVTIRTTHVCFKGGQRSTLQEFSVLNRCCGLFQ